MTTRRIGYLTSQYPAPSHTFIRREIAALRAMGLEIATYSIQRPPAGLEAPLDRAAAADPDALAARGKQGNVVRAPKGSAGGTGEKSDGSRKGASAGAS